MNIIQIGSYPLSADCIRGGVESSVFGLTQALFAAGNTIDVFDYPRIGGKDASERNGLLTIHRYANNGRHTQDAIQRGKEMFRDIVALHPDVVHIHGTGEFSSALYRAVRNYGIPAVLTVHGLLHEEKKQALRRHPSLKHLYQYIVQTQAEYDLLNDASPIIVDTDYVARAITRYHNRYKIASLPQMHVIPQGINEAYYNLKCSNDSKMILCVGAIAPRKGHLYTVEMFNTLRELGTKAKLHIIGSMADRHYYSQLMQKIQASPNCADITLQTNVSQEELFAAYEQAQLFVLHSQEESQGIVLAEAMATGLPIVATNVGGIPDVVESGRSGFLCDFGDTRAMAEMVERLITDQTLWQIYSTHAQQAAKRYNWTDIANGITKLYNKK